MAWEWSHTPEAYENVRNNISTLDHENLAVIVAEIAAKIWDDENEDKNLSFNNGKYDKFLSEAKELPHDLLADVVWKFAEKHRTCDNGGFNAHICPYGCHTVSFDHED